MNNILNYMNESSQKKENLFVLGSIILLFANLFLLISSYWFEYSFYFYESIIAVSVVLLLGVFVKRYIEYFSVIIGLLFYGVFVFFNYNFMFVLGGSIILGFLGLHFLKPELNIPHFVYSFLPLFILLHIIWFNILPMGFEGEWSVNVGDARDMSERASLFIIDSNRVLSPTQTFGDVSWRSFTRDGTFYLGFNTPIDFTGREVEIIIDYEATGPLYVNGQLIYDPAWGSSVNVGGFGDEFIYGADRFNLTIPFANVSSERFFNLTNTSSIEEYIFLNYDVNVLPHEDVFLGSVDLWVEREEIKEETNVTNLINSKFFNAEVGNESFEGVAELMLYLGVADLDELLRSPLEAFLFERNLTLNQFKDKELNEGPYPRDMPVDDRFSTIEEYIRGNFPDGVPMTDFTGKYAELENEMNQLYTDRINNLWSYPDWSSEPKTFEATIRGDVTFYALFDERIDLTVLKQDLNMYNGSDAVSVLVWDFDDNLVANWTIDDVDAPNSSSRSEWKQFSFSQELAKSGIHRIRFEHKYDENDFADFAIMNLTLNSNKAMIQEGRFFLWSPAVLFNTHEFNSMIVRYWWRGFQQDIILNNETIFRLSEDDMDVRKELNMEGIKSVEFQRGFVEVIPSRNLNLWENSYIDVGVEKAIHITKSFEFDKYNVKLLEVDGINITGTTGTKIHNIEIRTTK